MRPESGSSGAHAFLRGLAPSLGWLAAALLGPGSALAAPTAVRQLTDNSIDDSRPQISGEQIVWVKDRLSANRAEIMLFANDTTTPLTNDLLFDFNPHISGSKVVWTRFDGGDFEIMFYDGSTVVPLTDNFADDETPRISGDRVVWRGSDGNDLEIFLFDGNTTRQITSNEVDDAAPQISGTHITWERSMPLPPGSAQPFQTEIMFYDGVSIQRLTNNTQDDFDPRISGQRVVWLQNDENDTEVFLFDGAGLIQRLTNNAGDESQARVSGQGAAWVGDDGNDTEIFFFDGAQTTQVTDDQVNVDGLAMSGGRLVWISAVPPASQVMFWEGGDPIALTGSSLLQFFPAIDGDHAVWQAFDGADFEIFLAPEPAAALLWLASALGLGACARARRLSPPPRLEGSAACAGRRASGSAPEGPSCRFSPRAPDLR